MSGRHDDVIELLTQAADTIDERVLEALREAIANGDDRRPTSERHLTQARRAVEKAIVALRRADDDVSDDGSLDD